MSPFKLVSRDYKAEDTIIRIEGPANSVLVGQGYCTLIAGPCAVEDRDQYLELAGLLKASGAQMLRGGLFKPRTSPYSFQGVGREGLEILQEARQLTGMPVVTEIMDLHDIDDLYDIIDVFQVGSRNMQNYSLLEAMGRIRKPVLLKRGLSATIEEWLLAAEYILSGGNREVILCERGIRTFETYTRNTVDIGAVVMVKELSHLPVIVDPSHATGRWSMVAPVAAAAVAAGADGLMIEVHQDPDQALSDGKQSLTPDNFKLLLSRVSALARLEGRVIQLANTPGR